VDLQGSALESGAGKLEQVGTILDLPPIPRFREGFALLFARFLFRLLAIKDRRFVVLDLAREECRGRHLLLVAAHDHDLAPE
jgi:hypothetical protein